MKRPNTSSSQEANDRKGKTVTLRTNYTTLTSTVAEPVLDDGMRSSRITISLERVPEDLRNAKSVEVVLSKMSIPISGIPLVQIPIKDWVPIQPEGQSVDPVVKTYGVYFPVPYYFRPGEPKAIHLDVVLSSAIKGLNTDPIEEYITLPNGGEYREALANRSCSIHNASELAVIFSTMLKQCVVANIAWWNVGSEDLTGDLSDFFEVSTSINSDSIVVTFFLKKIQQCPMYIMGGNAPIVPPPPNTPTYFRYSFEEGDGRDTRYGYACMLLCVNKTIKERYPFLNWVDAYNAGIEHESISGPDQFYVWNSQDLVGTASKYYQYGNTMYSVTIPSSNIANSSCFCGLTVQCPSFPMVPQNYPVYYKNPLSTTVATANLSLTTEPIFEIYIPLIGKASDLDGYLVVNKESLSTAGPIPLDPQLISSLSNFFFEFKWIDNWGQLHDLHIPTNQNIFFQLTWFIHY